MTPHPPPTGAPAVQLDWWLCRGRGHAWPAREDAEACCYSHRLTCVAGVEPDAWPGPEPVLPLTGTGLGFCHVLVPWDSVESWTPAVGTRRHTEHIGPGPFALDGCSVYTIAYVEAHVDEVNEETRAWRERTGWTPPASPFPV